MSLKMYFPLVILRKQAYWQFIENLLIRTLCKSVFMKGGRPKQAGKRKIGQTEGSSQINVRLVGSTAEPTVDDASFGKRNESEPTVSSEDGGGGGLGSSPLG